MVSTVLTVEPLLRSSPKEALKAEMRTFLSPFLQHKISTTLYQEISKSQKMSLKIYSISSFDIYSSTNNERSHEIFLKQNKPYISYSNVSDSNKSLGKIKY